MRRRKSSFWSDLLTSRGEDSYIAKFSQNLVEIWGSLSKLIFNKLVHAGLIWFGL